VKESLARGDSLYELDGDLLRELEPDLVLTQDLCEVCSIDLDTVRSIAGSMKPEPRVLSLDPRTIFDVFDDLLKVGEAAGLSGRAERAMVDLRASYWEAIDFVNPYATQPEVLFLEWTDPPFCGGHWTPGLIEAAGGRPIPARVGHIFMKQAMHANAAVFGGELSGHFYYRDMFDADNAARATCSVLAGIARLPGTVSEAIEPLRKYAQSGELNFVNDDIEETLEELREHHEDARLSEMDGLSIDTGRWWANIRASNTEPLLRLNLEAPDPSTLELALQELAPLLGRPEAH